MRMNHARAIHARSRAHRHCRSICGKTIRTRAVAARARVSATPVKSYLSYNVHVSYNAHVSKYNDTCHTMYTCHSTMYTCHTTYTSGGKSLGVCHARKASGAMPRTPCTGECRFFCQRWHATAAVELCRQRDGGAHRRLRLHQRDVRRRTRVAGTVGPAEGIGREPAWCSGGTIGAEGGTVVA